MRKLFLLLFVVISLSVNAQYVVNYASNVNQSETDGFFYNLPRNVIRLDFVVENVQEIKGKYSAYAKELLDIEDYIKEDRSRYNIKSVAVEVLTEADDEMLFFISADEKSKDNAAFGIDLTRYGGIKSFGFISEDKDAADTEIVVDNLIATQEEPSVYHYIPLRDENEEDEENEENEDGIVESKDKPSEKDIAISIVEEIKKIRVAYFDLISGYQEVNYGNTITYMLEELKKMENEYLEMFLGKTVRNDFVKTFYVIPEEGTDNYSVAKFSDKEGFNSKAGDNVKIVLQNLSSSNAKKLTEDVVKNTTYNNKMVYREPAYVNMKLMKADDILLENRLSINQLGDLVLLPIHKMKLEFDEVSGRLISIEKE